MRIFNVMMSRGLGGIQQAYLDYHEALKIQGHEVINISSSGAKINRQLQSNKTLLNIAPWCFLSKIYMGILIAIYKPDLIICHGNRAVSFSIAFRPKQLPLIGVSHNYSYKHLKKCDYVITLTDKLREHLILHGLDSERLLSIPNMTRITHDYQPTSYKTPVIIGSFGRFVAKKGFVYLIESINLLKQSGHNVHLLLGGDGEDKAMLVEKTSELQLENEVTFCNWVNDKDAFFEQIDIFCLPSTIEPFGIILLEAMEHSKPIISTKSGGPEEIIRNNVDGLLAEIESGKALANKLQLVINDQKMAKQLAQSAYLRLKEDYDIKVVSGKLSKILSKVIKK